MESKARAHLIVVLAMTAALLAACGGGGGGGGGGGSGDGGFTVAATSVQFAAGDTQPPPAAQDIAITITGSRVAQFGAGWRNGADPGWLNVEIIGDAPDLTLRLTPNTTGLGFGDHAATLTVGTADANDNILVTRDITINYSIFAGLRASVASSYMTATLGAPAGNGQYVVNVVAPGKTWRVVAEDGWLVVPSRTFTGSGAAAVQVNPSDPSLSTSTSFGTIVVENTANPDDRWPLLVAVGVLEPVFTVSPLPIVVNGADGLGDGTGTVTLSSNTGTNSWPWTMQLLTNVAPNRLSLSATSGLVSGTPAAATLSFDHAGLATGSYAATARITYTVNAQTFTQDIPVAANVDTQRLYVPYNGVALSDFPGRKTLSRSVEVRHNGGRTGIPWTAQSDQPWLSVGGGTGVTGGALTLTANPAGLAPDQLHEAHVTLTSSHPDMSGSEVVRVGLWVGSADPAANVGAAVPEAQYRPTLATNPVEPWAYSTSGQVSGDVRVHNVHTGELVTTFTGQVGYATSLAVSSDGRRLLVTDVQQARSVVLDAATGALILAVPASAYAIEDTKYQEKAFGAFFFRPNGRELIWTAYDEVHFADTGAPVMRYIDGSWAPAWRTDPLRYFSADGSRQIEFPGGLNTSANTIYMRRFAWSNIPDPRLNFTEVQQQAFVAPWQPNLCFSGDGNRLFARAQFGAGIEVRSIEPWQTITSAGVPDGVATGCTRSGWSYVARNGVAPESGDNVYVLRPDGTTFTMFGFGTTGYQLWPYQRPLLSGDETRLVTFEAGAGGWNLVFGSTPALGT